MVESDETKQRRRRSAATERKDEQIKVQSVSINRTVKSDSEQKEYEKRRKKAPRWSMQSRRRTLKSATINISDCIQGNSSSASVNSVTHEIESENARSNFSAAVDSWIPSPKNVENYVQSDPENEFTFRNFSDASVENSKKKKRTRFRRLIMSTPWRYRRKPNVKKDKKNSGSRSEADSSGGISSDDELQSEVDRQLHLFTHSDLINRLPPAIGSSYLRGIDAEQWNSWANGNAQEFYIRSLGYLAHHKKETSLPSLYDVLAIDVYQSPYRICNMQARVAGLDKFLSDIPRTGHDDIPRLFVVNVQLPNSNPPMYSQGDGSTVHITIYMGASPSLIEYAKIYCEQNRKSEMPKDQRDDLKSNEIPNSVKLLAKWCSQGETCDSIRGIFKLIGDVRNMDTVGLPSFCRKFNKKPIIIHGGESSLVRDISKGIVELDVNGHSFRYMGRKGLYSTLHKWQDTILHVSMLLEGRSDEELPEQVLGVAIFRGLDLSNTKHLSLSADGKSLSVSADMNAFFSKVAGNTVAGGQQSFREKSSLSGKSRRYSEDKSKNSFCLSRSIYIGTIMVSASAGAFIMWMFMTVWSSLIKD